MFSDRKGSLGICWGELTHSVMEAQNKETMGDLPIWVERFLELRKTLCKGKDEYTLERYEFEKLTTITIVDLNKLLEDFQVKGNDEVNELQSLIDSLEEPVF